MDPLDHGADAAHEGGSGNACEWIDASGDAPRAIVVVEDHVDHLESLRRVLERVEPRLLAQTTFLCLDRAGPDTDRMLALWREHSPSLRVLAATNAAAAGHAALTPEVFGSHGALAATMGRALRAGGLLLQDVQLETLRFVPADRWWETVFLAQTVVGRWSEDPPQVRFLSNKRGYQATFGSWLLDAGFHPRDVLDKDSLEEQVVPVIQRVFTRRFPWSLELRDEDGVTQRFPARGTDAERSALGQSLDLLWVEHENGDGELRGRCCGAPTLFERGRVERPTWQALFAAVFEGTESPGTEELGRRLAPEGALGPEISNAASRHMGRMRDKLSERTAVETREHRYRLRPGLRVGRLVRRTE